MKYFIIAGEASGDMHGANMVKELKKLDTSCTIEGWGGDQMREAGVKILKPIQELAFMGFVEVLMNLKTILRNFTLCKSQILQFKPDVLILVDYPGFNLRMAKWAKKQGYKVMYYISPTIWAWKENRVETVKKYVDRMVCILPFEKAFYAKHGYKADYVGHPTVEVVANEKLKVNSVNEKKYIALLPGSRVQEIHKMLPLMLEAVSHFKDFEVVIAQAPNLTNEVFTPFIQSAKVKLVQHKTYDILKHAQAALVTSGTATLETALFGIPQVVMYKANAISYHIAKMLVKVKYISLVNLILDKAAVKELIQEDMNVKNIVQELQLLLNDSTRKQDIQEDYRKLSMMLQEGEASKETANIAFELALN